MLEDGKKISVKLIKSLIGRKPNHLNSARALGLKKINQKVSVVNNVYNRGLIKKISYLLSVEKN